MKFTFLFALLIPPIIGYSQFDSLGLNTPWYNGTLVLNDESKLEGLIQNNDKLGVIKFRYSATDEELSFQERSIRTMEYFDMSVSRKRTFYSLSVQDKYTGYEGALLFEVLMELQHFAVISKTYVVNPAIRARGGYDGFGTISAKVGYEHFEKIFLTNEAGEVDLLLMVNDFEKDPGKILIKKTKPFLDIKVLKDYLGSDSKKVLDYARERSWNLKEKYDLLLTLEYYAKLEKEL